MTEALKLFIERNIELIEDKNFEELYSNAYANWLNNLGKEIKPLDISALTDILTEIFGKEPIFDGNLTRVPKYYLAGNHKVVDVIIPEGIELIGKNAYKNCRNLRSLTLSKTLSVIGAAAFAECDKLNSIFYSGSVDEFKHIQLGMGCFASTGWVAKDKTVYCNDGEVKV